MMPYLEQRPTCVTVIGWFWMIVGGLMAAIGAGVLVLYFTVFIPVVRSQLHDPADPWMVLFLRLYPFAAVLQIGIGGLAAVSGYYFLRFRNWARSVLEGVAWLGLVYVAGFLLVWLGLALSSLVPHSETFPHRIMMLVGGTLGAAVYGVPLAIIVRCLRGTKVRNALQRR